MERKAKTQETLFEEFITDRIIKGCTEKTLLDYRASWGHYLLNSPGQLTKESWKQYLLFLTQSSISVASKNHYISHNRAVFYYLMNEGYCPQFKISLMRGQETECKSYTREEVKALLQIDLKHCSYVEHRCYAIICLILATGARCNTIINIKTTDIVGDYLTITTQKNKKATTIPLSPQCVRVIKDFRNTWDNDSEWLFSDRNGNQLTWSGLRLSMEDYFKAKGVNYKGVHSLRHTFAREFILNGGDALILQKMLGHSTLAMTKRYVYLYSEDCREAIMSVTPLDKIIKK